MSKYTSQPVVVERAAAEVAEKFDDLSALQTIVDNLPEAERRKLGDVEFTADTISIRTTQVGEVKFQITDRRENCITFRAVGAPVPVQLDVNIRPLSVDSCEVSVVFDVNVPMMLKPMVAPHMQKAVDMLGDIIGNVAKQ